MVYDGMTTCSILIGSLPYINLNASKKQTNGKTSTTGIPMTVTITPENDASNITNDKKYTLNY